MALPSDVQESIRLEMSRNVHVGARPLSSREWRALPEEAGFEIQSETSAPVHLLEPRRLVRGEGVFRALRFAFNVLRTPQARKRGLAMRRMFRRHREHLAAISFVAVKL